MQCFASERSHNPSCVTLRLDKEKNMKANTPKNRSICELFQERKLLLTSFLSGSLIIADCWLESYNKKVRKTILS